MAFNIEDFPTSISAQRMLSMVTQGFYDRSYVGKWLYQVMGLEMDDAAKIVNELPEQIFPETATWGLMWHEIKWQLPVRENLPYEERRNLIYQKRDFRAPMTPYFIEEYLKKFLQYDIKIADIHDPGEYGFTPSHPNIFKVYLVGDEDSPSLDSKYVHKTVNRLKQSHTTYTVNQRTIIIIDNSDLEKMKVLNINFKMAVPFWYCHVLDGDWLLDGHINLDQKRSYGLVLRFRQGYEIYNPPEDISLVRVALRWKIRNDETVRAKVKFGFAADFFIVAYLDGTWPLNGEKILNHSKARTRAKLTVSPKVDMSEQEQIGIATVETKTRDYWFLDGALNLDGSRKLNSVYRKEIVG